MKKRILYVCLTQTGVWTRFDYVLSIMPLQSACTGLHIMGENDNPVTLSLKHRYPKTRSKRPRDRIACISLGSVGLQVSH